MQIRIITDDFTSATDGVVAFAQAGWSAGVTLGLSGQGFSQALSVDTDSRLCEPAEAVGRVADWARRWKDANVLVKQFDSTLRGHVAHECLAAWRASRRARLLVVPAFPAAGRTTVKGVVMVDGVPVERTAFGRDPLNPVRISDVRTLFAEIGTPLVLATDTWGAKRAFDLGESAVMVDALTEEHLQQIVQEFAFDESILWTGSTGIVRALAGGLLPVTTKTSTFAVRHSIYPWVLLGSRNPRSRRQAQIVERVMPTVRVHRTADIDGDPHQVVRRLGERVAEAVHLGQCDGFIATGGETAKAAALALGATGISVVREIEPGVPLNVLHMGNSSVPFITKAGGFGDDMTLVRCVQSLTGELT